MEGAQDLLQHPAADGGVGAGSSAPQPCGGARAATGRAAVASHRGWGLQLRCFCFRRGVGSVLTVALQRLWAELERRVRCRRSSASFPLCCR